MDWLVVWMEEEEDGFRMCERRRETVGSVQRGKGGRTRQASERAQCSKNDKERNVALTKERRSPG